MLLLMLVVVVVAVAVAHDGASGRNLIAGITAASRRRLLVRMLLPLPHHFIALMVRQGFSPAEVVGPDGLGVVAGDDDAFGSGDDVAATRVLTLHAEGVIHRRARHLTSGPLKGRDVGVIHVVVVVGPDHVAVVMHDVRLRPRKVILRYGLEI